MVLDSPPFLGYTISTMKAGDLVKTTGFGPEGTTGELGIIIKASPLFLRVVIVYFNNGVQTPYAVDGLVVVNENRWLGANQPRLGVEVSRARMVWEATAQGGHRRERDLYRGRWKTKNLDAAQEFRGGE